MSLFLFFLLLAGTTAHTKRVMQKTPLAFNVENLEILCLVVFVALMWVCVLWTIFS